MHGYHIFLNKVNSVGLYAMNAFERLNTFHGEERKTMGKTSRNGNRRSRDRYRAPPSICVGCLDVMHGPETSGSRCVHISRSRDAADEVPLLRQAGVRDEIVMRSLRKRRDLRGGD